MHPGCCNPYIPLANYIANYIRHLIEEEKTEKCSFWQQKKASKLSLMRPKLPVKEP